jgi:hypothetical protein
MLEETNVSDGPPVEHSIMKRAWPYALALAVVVTGCYLALAPLLRSLSPAPTTSAASPLTRGHNVTTVGKSKGINVVRSPRVTSSFVGNLKTNTKKTTTKKKAKKSTVTTPTATTGFATNQTSTSTTPSTITKTPKKSSSTPTKTASKAKGASVVGGKVDATPTGGGGFATGGGDSGSSDFGQSSNVGP